MCETRAAMSKRRAALVWGLVILASLVTLVSSLLVWSKRQLLDSDNWTKSSAKLLANDEIRGALSVKLVDLLFERVDVPAQLKEELPKQAQAVAPAAAGALRTAAIRGTDAFLATPQAQNLWEEANRRASTQLIAVLKEEKVRNISTENGVVTLDLRPMIRRVADRLGLTDRLRARASPTAGQIVLVKAKNLDAAQNAVKVVRAVSLFLVIA